MIVRALRPLLAVACVVLAVWQVQLLVKQLSPEARASEMDTARATQGPFEVGFARPGVLISPSTVVVRVPEQLAWRGTRLTYLAPDGSKVKTGDLLAKLDVSQYRFEVDNQKLEYQQAVQEVGSAKRRSEQEVEQAANDLIRQESSTEIQGKSSSVEMEQAKNQIGFDTWEKARAEKDYERWKRLRVAELAPGTQVEQAERTWRAKEYSLTASQKDLVQKEKEQQIKQSQSKVDVDTARFNVELSKRRVKETERESADRVKRTKEQMDRMMKDLASGELRAPSDGTLVLEKTWDEGGQRALRVGDQLRETLGGITDPVNLVVSARVSEAVAAKVKVGQEVVVTAEGVPGRRFQGKVTSMGTVAHTVDLWEDATAAPNDRVFDVTITLRHLDPKVLRPGMKVKATYVLRRLPKALSVPLAALIHRPGKGEFVYVKTGSGFKERRVETGERNDETVVIRRGLQAGDRVALGDPTAPGEQ